MWNRSLLACALTASVSAFAASIVLLVRTELHHREASRASLVDAPRSEPRSGLPGTEVQDAEAGSASSGEPLPERKITDTPFRPDEEQWEGGPVSRLLEALEQGSDVERGFAATSLGHVFLGSEFFDGRASVAPRDVRLREIAAAKERGPGVRAKAIVPLLIKALDDPAPDVRCAAVRALMFIGPEALSACPRLRSALKDAVPRVRALAAEALYHVGHDVLYAVDANIGLLEEEDSEIRLFACSNLSKMEEDGYPSIPFLEKRLQDPDASVRENAGIAIRRILASYEADPARRRK